MDNKLHLSSIPFMLLREKEVSQYRLDVLEELLSYHMKFMLLREKEVSQYRLDVLEELLSYHMKAFEGDVETLCLRESHPFDEQCPPDFHRFTFVPRSLNHVDSVQAAMFMFVQLHFVQRWQIPIPVLTRFILTVQRNYRNPPYHNWTHAFCVGHFAFLCLTNASQRLQGYLDPLELFALLVGALCHDIDHRGYNNAYQRLSGSALASLYGANGSILENHHVDHTIRILRIKECDIFVNLTAAEDQRAMRLLRQIILATDLENHVQLVPKIRAMASQGGYDPTNVEHHVQLLSILVTSSDLSDQCKPWVNTRVAASLIYREFFHQGDCEKSLDMQPPHSMDRSKAFIPDLQISFLDSIVLPCFQ
ncbi:hypothetical protein AHF37_01436 [Paragonimus kellicotti]|nr:hypothetical protein AHF37_01436 [Paragonimus kellicotti]